MTLDIATSITGATRTKWYTRTPINGGDYGEIIPQYHRAFAHSGFRLPGIYWPNDYANSDGMAYDTKNENAGRTLDTWQGLSRVHRELADGGGSPVEVAVEFVARIKSLDVRCAITRRNSDGTTDFIANIDITEAAGSWTVVRGTHTMTIATANDGGTGSTRGLIYYDVTAKAETATVAGYMSHFTVMEAIVDATKIPTEP